MNDRVLSAKGLTCERDGRVLFAVLDLDLSSGEIVELTGANGSGKTTLLRILAGLQGGYTGTVDVSRSPGWVHYLGHRVALSAVLSPLENLAWYAGLCGDAGNATLQRESLERVGLAGYEDTPCHHLSAGQQRRVTLARLVPGNAVVWLLDEPLTALDTEASALLRALLEAHRQRGGAAVCATHQPLGLPSARRLELGVRP